MIFVLLYYACITVANITANIFWTIPVIQLSFAVGTLFFGPIFTLRDKIHSIYGKNKTYGIIIGACAINTLIALLGAFDIRIVIASVIALFISESLDTEVYHQLRKKRWIFRVLGSNAISAPIDTIIFTLVAFLNIFPTSVLFSVIIGDTIIKYIMAAIIIPLLWNRKTHI